MGQYTNPDHHQCNLELVKNAESWNRPRPPAFESTFQRRPPRWLAHSRNPPEQQVNPGVALCDVLGHRKEDISAFVPFLFKSLLYFFIKNSNWKGTELLHSLTFSVMVVRVWTSTYAQSVSPTPYKPVGLFT